MINSRQKYLSITFLILSIIFFSIFIITLNINTTIFDENLFHKEFEKHNVYTTLKDYNINNINKEVLAYLDNKATLQNSFFTPREISHLQDVKNLITKIKSLLYISLFLAVISLALLYVLDKKAFPKKIYIILLSSGILILILNLLLIISVTFNFTSSFDKFHRIFFTNETWLFNPETEKIVVLYPFGLFYDFGAKIITNSIIASIILIAVSIIRKNI